jgi:hypothetical protein
MANGVFSVTVPLTPAYSNTLVQMAATTVTIEIPLVPGEGLIQTPLQQVGTLTYFANPALMACITMWGSYDPDGEVLTFCSPDLVDNDSTYLTTVPAGSNQGCNQHTYTSDTAPCGVNPNWNYCTPLTPGLQQELLQSIRTAQQMVIDAAIAQGFTVIVRTPPPPMSAADYAGTSLIYQNGVFKEFYDPDKAYDASHTLVHALSVWYGEITLSATDYFANVLGSTTDPKIASLSWIALWRNQFGTPTACSSYNYNGFTCGTTLYGGHVVLGTAAQNVSAGSNKVFIMPICSGHNNVNFTGTMAPVKYNKGIAIHNYLGW